MHSSIRTQRPAARISSMAEGLWRARYEGTTLPSTALSLEEARLVLGELTRAAVADGDEVIGWKIARLLDEHGNPFLFVGPVFDSSIGSAQRSLISPRVEVEYVARIDEIDAAVSAATMTWHLGIEVVDNHAPDWSLSIPWAIADWGLHAGAALGVPCPEPTMGAPVDLSLQIGEVTSEQQGTWRTGVTSLLNTLGRDCPRLLRPCQPGDLIWTGSLAPPVPLPVGADVEADVKGIGSVHLDRANFWSPWVE